MPYLKEFSLELFKKEENNKRRNVEDQEFIPFDFNQNPSIIDDFSKGNFSRYEQSLKDQDILFIPDKDVIQFRRETACVTSLFGGLFEKLKTQECWKVEVHCVNKVEREFPDTVGGVAEVEVLFDKDEYFNSNEEEKKRIALDALFTGITKAVEVFNWDIQPFLESYNKVLSYNINNRFIYGKPKYNSNRKFLAEVYCEHKINSFDINVIIKDREGNEITRELVKTEIPDPFLFSRHLGNLKWVSVNKVELTNKNNTEKWIVKF